MVHSNIQHPEYNMTNVHGRCPEQTHLCLSLSAIQTTRKIKPVKNSNIQMDPRIKVVDTLYLCSSSYR